MHSIIVAGVVGTFALASHAELVTHTFGGHVTALPSHVNPLPALWADVQMGDAMEVSFTYDTAALGSPSGAYTHYRGVVSAWSIKIGSVSVSGTLPPVPTTSNFWVRDGASDVLLGDFLTAPVAAAQWGIGLTDHDGLAFDGGGTLPGRMRFSEFDEASMGLWRTPGPGPTDSLQSTIEWYVPGPGANAVLACAGFLMRRRR